MGLYLIIHDLMVVDIIMGTVKTNNTTSLITYGVRFLNALTTY